MHSLCIPDNFQLQPWKLTLPTSGAPEITQPTLNSYTNSPYFYANSSSNCDYIHFQAPTDGDTTPGSDYPRSELREMTSDGDDEFEWSNTSETHIMMIDQAIVTLPLGKKHIVAGQIHDDGNDVIMLRLEDDELFLEVDGDEAQMLDDDYTLGTRFTTHFIAKDGDINVHINNAATPAYTLDQDISDAFFKAGAYTQSNCSTESSRGQTCSSSNYGAVNIYGLQIRHYDETEVNPGDCNGDGNINAADLSAVGLEIYDGDGTSASNANLGTFLGTPQCDANQSGTIEAGDLTCTGLKIFDPEETCS